MKIYNAIALLLGILLAEGTVACGHPRHPHVAPPAPKTAAVEEQPPTDDGLYIINPGAGVEIILVPTDVLQKMGDFPYPIVGSFHPAGLDGDAPKIFLAWDGGPHFPAVALTLLHEYEHLVERECPESAPKLRHAFLKLQARDRGLDFSQVDLADELPPFDVKK